MNLFEQNSINHEPLASRMRPRNLDEYIGQDHIIGEGRLLRRAIQADRLTSVIFYGPPGTGKTTLARVIAGSTKSRFVTLNAVLSGVKQVRESIDEAKMQKDLHGRKTILFVDEVHRWNKAQQDALLPWVENGTVVLIGATTENPYFEVNSALVSRSRVFQLVQLTSSDLANIARQAMADPVRGYGQFDVQIEKEALEHLVQTAAGDARSLLGALELAVETSAPDFPPSPGTAIKITLQTAEESIQKKVVLYDKEGDYHYDTISAFIKSLRGSDPDGALYWLARMIRAGEDPKFILRRMMISASEDIGMADPKALTIITSVAQAFERVGLPEGQFFLSQGAIYLATAPKSNSTMGYFDALRSIEREKAEDVPNHLKDPSRDKHSFGHGADYKYPHAYQDHWVSQAYLPENLRGALFYKPGKLGFEGSIQQDVHRKREAALESMLNPKEEILTYSPENKTKDKWLQRANNHATGNQETLRNKIMINANLARHHKVFLPWESSGLLLWECLRGTPEGVVFARITKEEQKKLLEGYLQTLEELDRPVLFTPEETPADFETIQPTGFDRILGKDCFTSKESWDPNMQILKDNLQTGEAYFSQVIPLHGQKLSQLLPESKNREDLEEMENQYYAELDHPYFWNPGKLINSIEANQLKMELLEEIVLKEHRIITERQLNSWLKEDKNTLGKFIKDNSKADVLTKTIRNNLLNAQVEWTSKHLILKISKSN